MRPKRTVRRRGVLLIIILALLAMFALIAVAFVIVAGHASTSAESVQRVQQYHDPPEAELNRALMQVLRGPPTGYSAIGPHSLLEDVYGSGTVMGQFQSVTPLAGGELVEFTYSLAGASDPNRWPGCVLTLLISGNPNQTPAGQSTHVVGVNPQTGNPEFRALEIGQPLPGDTFVINGVPFSGTGFGYNPSPPNYTIDATVSVGGETCPLALLPGHAGNLSALGGANEDYDAADFQNMILAAQLFYPHHGVNVTLPSLHRPALINYWMNHAASWATNLDLQRAVMLRPHPQDHCYTDVDGSGTWDPGEPDFTGEPFHPLGPFLPGGGYQWDVDNDGDLVRDSIWVDLGFPVRSATDGRLYKPLFAILCVDMDGRLNVNAQGCWAQTMYSPADATAELPSSAAGHPVDIAARGFAFAGATPQPAVIVPRGMGRGPADVNLIALFEYAGGSGLVANWQTYYQSLLGGSASLGLCGRYGEARGPNPTWAMPGWTGIMDPAAFNDRPDFPASPYAFVFTGNTTELTSYGSPADLKCGMAVGLDLRGSPLYTMLGNDWLSANMDHPYEQNLSGGVPRGIWDQTTIDNPFSLAELERVLRPFDRDATMLPPRLALLTSPLALPTPPAGASLDQSPLFAWRHIVTTHSMDLPCPGVVTPSSFTQTERARLPQYRAWHLTDLLRAKSDLLNPAVNPNARQAWRYLLPLEMLSELKLDLNRPLGDGRDNGGNGVVDEPGRVVFNATSGQFELDPTFPGEIPSDAIRYLNAAGAAVSGYFNHTGGIDVNNDGVFNTADEAMARQLAARHLFVLLMLLRDPAYVDLVKLDPGNTLEPTLTSAAEKQELWDRRLAQWAVNAVDFRDADSIMTPFEYDRDPFTDANGDGNPWDVDGVIAGQGVASPDDTAAYRGLVWGCERPELLLTECFATHARRVADTRFDTRGGAPGGNKKRIDDDDGDHNPDDEDLDQTRIPQGTAIFELYCTRRASDPVAPGDLYSYSPAINRWYLDLERLAPPGQANLQYPVWRLAISGSHIQRVENDLAWRLGVAPNPGPAPNPNPNPQPVSTSLQPERMSLLRAPTQATPPIELERIVWFTGQPPANNHHAGEYGGQFTIYYRHGGTAAVLPGGYVVVGPRAETVFGVDANGFASPPAPSAQMIAINAGGVIDVTEPSMGNSTMPGIGPQIKAPLGMICAADPPNSWHEAQHQTEGIGISVSEPLPSIPGQYYPEPDVSFNGRMEWYGDPNQTDANEPFLDEPLERRDTGAGASPSVHYPINYDELWDTQTVRNYRTVFLQRLANPLEPYDKDRNPYITVDWSPIDLTVFNGEDKTPAGWPDAFGITAGTPWDPDDGNPDATAADTVAFETRQRGDVTGPNAGKFNLWAQSTEEPDWTSAGAGGAIFDHVLVHSLGYLNEAFQETPGSPPASVGWAAVDGYPEHIGDPKIPFPWLAWNNRPYVGHHELLLVPASHPGRLLFEYGVESPADPAPVPYAPTAPDEVRYPNLLNFFESSMIAGDTAQLHRLLDFVNVRSPFVATDDVGNPGVFGNPSAPDYGQHEFMAPFNRIPRYRDPGKINPNTVYNEEVWRGLTNYFPDGNPLAASPTEWQWRHFVMSRRGYGTLPAQPFDLREIFQFNAQVPTFFANPVRTAGGGQLVPIGAMLPAREVDATLLRADPTTSPERPLLRWETSAPYRNTDRNPYFHYEGLQRLANLTTPRSNVYAIWITMGYFEVEPNPGGVDPAHPDGYRLRQELGIDTGEVTRHRAFYIIDRTVPVGFQRGYDLNTEKAILLKRFIE